MTVKGADEAWEDYLWWHKHDRRVHQRINRLIDAIAKDPFWGIGKPEPLRHTLAGYWSRRINEEHRLVYKVEKGVILVAACRYDYGK
jgi:toxin YoeB